MLVEGSDTAHNLATGMQKVFQARGISEKVKAITSDNASNVKAAVKLLQVRLQPCFEHTLNFDVNVKTLYESQRTFLPH